MLGLAHHAGLADPAGVGAQEAQVVVDCCRGQAALHPAAHHQIDVAVGELARIEIAKSGVAAQLTKEAREEALAVNHRLRRHALVLYAVGVVVLVQNGAEDSNVVGAADRKELEDGVGVDGRAGCGAQGAAGREGRGDRPGRR